MTFTEGNTKRDSSLISLFRELVGKQSGDSRVQLEALLTKIEWIEEEFKDDFKERQRKLASLVQEVRQTLPASSRSSREFINFVTGVQSMINKDHDDAQQRGLGKSSRLDTKRPTYRH